MTTAKTILYGRSNNAISKRGGQRHRYGVTDLSKHLLWCALETNSIGKTLSTSKFPNRRYPLLIRHEHSERTYKRRRRGKVRLVVRILGSRTVSWVPLCDSPPCLSLEIHRSHDDGKLSLLRRIIEDSVNSCLLSSSPPFPSSLYSNTATSEEPLLALLTASNREKALRKT